MIPTHLEVLTSTYLRLHTCVNSSICLVSLFFDFIAIYDMFYIVHC